MNIAYDTQKLNDVLKDFSNACGINISIVNKASESLGRNTKIYNGYCREIQKTSMGMNACLCSDKALFEKCKNSKKSEIQICHAGLIDVAVPLILNEEIIGYIILGQMKKQNDFPFVIQKLSNLTVDLVKLKGHYDELHLFDEEKINGVANIALMLSNYILFEKFLKPNYNIYTEKAAEFINSNFKKNLTIKRLSQETGISKSVLYKNFKTEFNCTPGEYINNLRVEKAIELLLNTDLSIENISYEVGFSSGAYYSKIFKKLKGVSPLKFKKQAKHM